MKMVFAAMLLGMMPSAGFASAEMECDAIARPSGDYIYSSGSYDNIAVAQDSMRICADTLRRAGLKVSDSRVYSAASAYTFSVSYSGNGPVSGKELPGVKVYQSRAEAQADMLRYARAMPSKLLETRLFADPRGGYSFALVYLSDKVFTEKRKEGGPFENMQEAEAALKAGENSLEREGFIVAESRIFTKGPNPGQLLYHYTITYLAD